MVKKSTIIFCSVLASVDVGLVLYSLLAHQGEYLYTKFNFRSSTIEDIVTLLVINSLAFLLFNSIQKRRWIVAGLLTHACIIVTVLAVVISGFMSRFGSWVSETDNYEEYVGADSGNSSGLFYIAGLDVDDITNREIEKVENFYYYYHNAFFGEEFKFKGEFYFSEEDYAELKEWFSNHEDLNETIYTTEEQGIYGYTGFYEFRENAPEYSAVEWDEFNISFCDEKSLIRFNVDALVSL